MSNIPLILEMGQKLLAKFSAEDQQTNVKCLTINLIMHMRLLEDEEAARIAQKLLDRFNKSKSYGLIAFNFYDFFSAMIEFITKRYCYFSVLEIREFREKAEKFVKEQFVSKS